MSTDKNKKMGWAMLIVMWALIFIMLAAFFSEVLDRQHNPNQSVETSYIEDKVTEVRLQRNRFGHYVSSGNINNVPVEFMLDTGATGVVVPEHLSIKLGLKKGFPVTVHTANGRLQAYEVKLDKVSIGGIVLNDVKALINPAEETDVILLGMSFLKHIEFTQKKDTLILRQDSNEF